MFLMLCRPLYALLERWRGPASTHVFADVVRHRTASVVFENETILFEITSKRMIYETHYKNPLASPRRRAIFEVKGSVLQGNVTDIHPLLLETVIYPNISSDCLLDTEYPHLRAISAFLSRVETTLGVKTQLL